MPPSEFELEVERAKEPLVSGGCQVKAALVLAVMVFMFSLGGLVFGDNIYVVLGSTNMVLARTVAELFQTKGVVPVLQGAFALSGFGLAIIGMSYGSQH